MNKMKTTEIYNQVQIHYGILKSYAYKLTNNREDSNDLVQDTIVKALSNQDKYESNSNLKGWLFTIMKNIFINNYRRASKSKVFNDPTDNQFYLNSTKNYSRNLGESRVFIKDVEKAVRNLSENLRTPFEMRNSGYKYEEIAERLSIPLGTVKIRIFNARTKLSRQLEAYN